ncbi:hypothetical protein [Amycolatopsis minnesotensis]|uniref:Uncharacterized protein n=1 Tax=Amycolatopsis minnesotensis TaxID=337894 RepID=A0ABN2R9E6_9PSEU
MAAPDDPLTGDGSEAGQWSLYWANGRDGALLPPVTGDFADGEGWFCGGDGATWEPNPGHGLHPRRLRNSA